MFGKRIPLFRVFGFEIGIDPSWIFLAFLITWSLAMGIFRFNFPGLSSSAYWVMGITGAFGLFVSVLLHELSHSLVARHYGLSLKGITLFLFGGVAEMEGEPESPKVEFRMAIIGPIVSAAIGGIFYAILAIGRNLDWPNTVNGVLGYLATINVILAAFNLLPAFPLDGGRVLRAALWKRKKNLVQATETASKSGNVFGWILISLGVLGFFRGNLIGGMWWVLIGMFLRGAAKLAYQQVLVRDVLHGENIDRFMTPDPITIPPHISLQEFVDQYLYRYHHKMFPVTEGTRLLGCIEMQNLKTIPSSEWSRHRVLDLTAKCSKENTVRPGTDAEQALKLMSKTGNSRLLVAEGDRILGVVVLKDMMKQLSIRLELAGYERLAA